MDKGQKFYITTPIYYVNARPHIGHAYTTLVCDAIARRKRMLGYDTFFLTGTDEHGQKIERSAAAAGTTPQQFTDEVSAQFRKLFDRMNITYNDFIRTTEPRHEQGVQALWKRLEEKGFIYKGTYTGQYCVSDEAYVDSAKPGDPCPDCGRITETVSEENYYFKLSAFSDKLLKYFEENQEFVRPETRRNEVIAFMKSGLRDLSISRSTFKWGVAVPGHPEHIVYVWLDALINYIAALGFGSKEKESQEKFARYWPADVQMIGKEMLREIVFGQDGSFSFDALVQRYDSDLANGLGNLSSRTLTMISRYFNGSVPYPSPTVARKDSDDVIKEHALRVITEFGQLFDDYQFSRALESAWSLVGAVNKYLVEEEPWIVAEKEGEESRARLATILYTSAEALRIVTALVYPVLPESAGKIWNQLGLGEISKFNLADLKWAQLPLGGKLGKVEPVFPRADKIAIERMQQMEQERNASAPPANQTSTDSSTSAAPAGIGTGQPAPQPPPGATLATAAPKAPAPPPPDGKITIDDFMKVELRVGQVKFAEKVKGADKLLRLEVDIGTEVRQLVAGIALAYEPESLIGRKVVIVANLQPRKLRGLESNGMIVAASVGEDGKPVLAGFLEDVPIGSKLK